jgi:hypothetical protein
MRRLGSLLFILSFATTCIPQEQAAHRLTYGQQQTKKNAASTSNSTILYRGGPVMIGPNNLYVIYYGSFTATQQSILNNFLSNLGGSNAFNVVTEYYNAANQSIQNSLNYSSATMSYNDAYSQGKKLASSSDIAIVGHAINSGVFPPDANGIYIVTVSTDVAVPKSWWCAYHWHSTSIVSGYDIKYAIAPDPPASMYSGCSGNVANYGDTTSPNGDIGMDAVTDDLIHEIGETVTDPDGNAWLTKNGYEMADLCNFVYGPTQLAPNGSHADHTPTQSPIGSKSYYLAQELWARTSSSCSLGP